ncbi:MAG: thioredoxin family protein [Euryarchaeota archaeon]|nr:thioredoxin family protein [Euryarchaeota archaeon]
MSFSFVSDEEAEVRMRSGRVVLWFSSPSCPPCRKVEPRAERVAKAFSGEVSFLRINVEKGTALAEKLGIDSVPTFVFLRDSRELKRLELVPSEEELEAAVRELL